MNKNSVNYCMAYENWEQLSGLFYFELKRGVPAKNFSILHFRVVGLEVTLVTGTSTELLVYNNFWTLPHPTRPPGVITIHGRGHKNSNFWPKWDPRIKIYGWSNVYRVTRPKIHDKSKNSSKWTYFGDFFGKKPILTKIANTKKSSSFLTAK